MDQIKITEDGEVKPAIDIKQTVVINDGSTDTKTDDKDTTVSQNYELTDSQLSVLENFRRVTSQKSGVYVGRLVMVDEKLFTIKKFHGKDITLRLAK